MKFYDKNGGIHKSPFAATFTDIANKAPIKKATDSVKSIASKFKKSEDIIEEEYDLLDAEFIDEAPVSDCKQYTCQCGHTTAADKEHVCNLCGTKTDIPTYDTDGVQEVEDDGPGNESSDS